MKYELIHDTIAQQINEKASLEAKARRRARVLVERQYERHQINPRILLSPEDLDEIRLFADHLNFSPEIHAFILRSRRAVNARRNRILGLAGAAVVVLTALLLWALYQGNLARAESRRAKAIALAGKSLEAQLEGDLTRSLGLAQASYRLDPVEETLYALYRAFLNPDAYYYSISLTGLEYRDVDALLSPRPPHHLLTMAPDGVITIWNEDLQKLARLEGHQSFATSASFSGDGSQLVTGATDSTARIWRIAGNGAPHQVAVLPHRGQVRNVFWSHRQPVILTLSSEGLALRWDTTGRLLDTLLQRPTNYRLSLSADGAYIAGTTPAYTCFWDAAGQPVDSVPNPFQPRDLLIGPPLAGGGSTGYPVFCKGYSTASIYRWQPGSSAFAPFANQDRGLEASIAIDLSPQGAAFNVASFLRRDNDQHSGLIRVWNFADSSNAVIRKTSIPEYGADNFIPLLHPNGRWMYSVSDGQTIRRWELGPRSRPYHLVAELGENTAYQWLQQSAVVFPQGDSLRLLALPGGNQLMAFPLTLRQPELAVTLAGERIACWQPGTTVIDIYDLKGKHLGAIETDMVLIRALRFSADGRFLLSAGYGQDKHQLHIWETTGAPPIIVELPEAPLDVRFDPSANNRLFIINNESEVLHMMINRQQLVPLDTVPITIDDPEALDIVYRAPSYGNADTPAGLFLVHMRYDSINIWRASTNGYERYQSLISADEAFEGARLAVSPPLLITLEGDEAQLRRLSSGPAKVLGIAGIQDLRFSADGQSIMLLTTAGQLQAWPWQPPAILKKIDAMGIAVPESDIRRLASKGKKQ